MTDIYGDRDHAPGRAMPSPVNLDAEAHAYAVYLQCCDDIETYQLEHGLDVPQWLWDRRQEAHDRWLHKRPLVAKGKPFDGFLFELQLKQFEKQWAAEAKEMQK